MLAVALATLLGTLWLTGAIGFLPSPFATTTTTIAAAPTTTAAPAPSTTLQAIESSTTDSNSASTITTVAATTTTVPVADLQVVFEDDFSSNTNGWADDEFSDADGTSFYHLTGGAYEAGYSIAVTGETYYSLVPFSPGAGLYYIETEVTSLAEGSQCGLALQMQAGPLLATAIGNGQLIARLYADGDIAEEGTWDVSVVEPNQNEIGLWVDGTTLTVYVDDLAIDFFDEPRLAGVNQIGVSISGGTDAYCSFDYLMVWNG